MEEELVAWIDAVRAENMRITRSCVQRKAIELAQTTANEGFCASRGWLEFFKRKHVSASKDHCESETFLRPHSKGHQFCHKDMKAPALKGLPLSSIANMDETPMWLDMPGETTVARTGDRSIPIRTTGHNKGRFSCTGSHGRWGN